MRSQSRRSSALALTAKRVPRLPPWSRHAATGCGSKANSQSRAILSQSGYSPMVRNSASKRGTLAQALPAKKRRARIDEIVLHELVEEDAARRLVLNDERRGKRAGPGHDFRAPVSQADFMVAKLRDEIRELV